jgi:hypothetical protein
MKTRSLFIALALVLAACGGADSATDSTAVVDQATTTAAAIPETTAAEETVTTDAVETTTGDTVLVDSLDEIPEVCRETFVSMLRTVEPVVEGVDFDALTVEEFEPLFEQLDADMTAFDQQMVDNGCDLYSPDVADETVWQELVDLAEDEAPGSVGFLTWTRDLASSFAGGDMGGTATGDCATDGAALVALAEEGRTMQQMTMAEVGEVTALFTSISTNCTFEEMPTYLEDPAVVAMLG